MIQKLPRTAPQDVVEELRKFTISKYEKMVPSTFPSDEYAFMNHCVSGNLDKVKPMVEVKENGLVCLSNGQEDRSASHIFQLFITIQEHSPSPLNMLTMEIKHQRGTT